LHLFELMERNKNAPGGISGLLTSVASSAFEFVAG
jgi:hypothetical protein